MLFFFFAFLLLPLILHAPLLHSTNWSTYTCMTELPSYMDAQLNFDLESAGFLLDAVFLANCKITPIPSPCK